MTSQRVRDMTAASALTGTELFYADDGSTDVRVTANQIKTFASITPGGATGIGYIYLSQEGVVGDGSTDDTAALNTLFNSLIGASGTIIWDVGFCKTTGRVTIGDESGGAGAATTFLNIICPYGSGASGIRYYGPSNDIALRFAKNKYFYVRGLNIDNFSGTVGTTIGLQLGGAGADSFGTQCLSGIFENCGIYGFDVGIIDGNAGASSEILWKCLSLGGNNTGWYGTDFNTLDHEFIELSMSENGVGLDSGATEGWSVYGGSCTNSTTADFQVRSNGVCHIYGYRSENNINGSILKGVNARDCTLRNCQAKGAESLPNNSSVSGAFARLAIDDCNLSGWVKFSNQPESLIMMNNRCRIDFHTSLPFIIDNDYDYNVGVRARLHNNSDSLYNTPETQALGYEGLIVNKGIAGTFGAGVMSSFPTVCTIQEFRQTANTTPVNYGTDYLALGFVRSLCEGPVPNSPYENTAVTNAATAAGSAVLNFASVPSWVMLDMWVKDITNNNIPSDTQVISTTSTTVTLNKNATGGGVVSGDTITFQSSVMQLVPGKNLRVSGTFATSGTLSFLFQRSVVGGTTPLATQGADLVLTSGNFYPSDVGKPIKIDTAGQHSWTDWYGFVAEYTDSTHATVAPSSTQGAPFTGTQAFNITIGQDEPDANYMVVGIVGDPATPESYSVTAVSTTGITFKSSNASSTATITALIVR